MTKEKFEKIYEQYQPLLFQFLLKKTGSHYFTKEVVQLTFIKLWQQNMDTTIDVDPQIQVFQIAKTTLVDVWRKEHREHCKRTGYVQNHDANSQELEQNGHIKDVERLMQWIENSMPPMRKLVFSLRIRQELTYKEIAKMLDISVKTVARHIDTAMHQVRPLLNRGKN